MKNSFKQMEARERARNSRVRSRGGKLKPSNEFEKLSFDYDAPVLDSVIHIHGPYVYFIQAVDGGPIKIGKAFNVRERLAGLQTGNPKELRILGAMVGDTDVEGKVHKEFAGSRIRGEWFEPSEELYDYIQGVNVWKDLLDLKRVALSGDRNLIIDKNSRLVIQYVKGWDYFWERFVEEKTGIPMRCLAWEGHYIPLAF